MRKLCPICHGKGTIDDPKCVGQMSYCGPTGEAWPQVYCQTCSGSGWVDTTEVDTE